jgi:RimJ/RimL family protein N-acetyltransferase
LHANNTVGKEGYSVNRLTLPIDTRIIVMELITKRFLLRDFIEDDLPAFVRYHEDPRSFEFYGVEEAKPNHAQELFQIFKTWSLENPRRNYQLAIVDRRNLKLIGCCGLRRESYDSDKAEMGIELAP